MRGVNAGGGRERREVARGVSMLGEGGREERLHEGCQCWGREEEKRGYMRGVNTGGGRKRREVA